MLRLLLFLLPLGLDTLGVSINVGIKSRLNDKSGSHHKWGSYGSVECGLSREPIYRARHVKRNAFPPWLVSALLFSIAETVMPVVGLALGYAVSLLLSSI